MSENTDRSNHNRWRTQPMYTFTEAARLARVSPSTVRNWLFGYTIGEREAPPLFKRSEEQRPFCSFLQLVEIVIAAQFRKEKHVSFQAVRRAHENARKEWGLEFPFAHLELRALGGHIVHLLRPRGSLAPSHPAIDQPGQWSLPGLVEETIRQLDYESELAARWYPAGKDVPIVIDPRISAGLPVIVGRGVTIEAIDKRFHAGHTIEFIAKDFRLKHGVVQEAIRYVHTHMVAA